MIVLFIKGKMFQTENYLPFFCALQKYAKKKMLVIYPSRKDYLQIKQNEDVFLALKNISQVKHFYSRHDFFNNTQSTGSNKIKHKLLIPIYGIFSVIQRNLLLNFFLYKSVSLFYTDEIPYTNWLAKLNIFFLKGKNISLLIYPFGFSDFKKLILRVSQDINNFSYIDYLLKMKSNTIISSYKENDLKKISKPLVKKFNVFNIGSDLYFWPTWLKLLEKQAKRDISFLKKTKYIFFPLSVIKRTSFTPTSKINLDLTNTIHFLLNTLNKISKSKLVIIRPHPTTNIEELLDLLKESKHKKIKIMNTNSIFLIKYSEFIMKYGISMMDPKACYFNKVCLRYHSNDLIKISGPQLSGKNDNIKKNIYDITSKKIFSIYLSKAINNKIRKNLNSKKAPKEKLILKDFLKYIS